MAYANYFSSRKALTQEEKDAKRAMLTENGIRFASIPELKRYRELLILKSAGKIGEIEVHPRYPCIINGRKICTAEFDFRYSDSSGSIIIEDVKPRGKGGKAAVQTEVSRIKRALAEQLHGISVTIVPM